MFAGLKTPLTGEMRIFLANVVESARQQNRRQAAKHDRRQHLGKEIALGLVKDLRVADRERYCALADTAGHDWDDDEEECVERPETKQNADERTDQGSHDRSGDQRYEYFEKAFNKHASIHPQDASDDYAGNEQ